MKKLFLLLTLVGMIFTACDKDNDGNNGNHFNDSSVDIDPNNPLNKYKCASNEILYVSKSGSHIELDTNEGWGASLISNTYDGIGRLKFDARVTTIPKNAFKTNELLEYIKMPNSVTSIGNGAFSYCSSLISVTIPDSVTSIGGYAFYGCSSLISVTIPDSVTSIGEYTFYDCTSLTSVTLGNSITVIGMYSFNNCSSLIDITIPESVTSIGKYLFSDCTSLKSVYCKPSTPPIGDSSMFYNNASGRKIYVPRASVNAYKSASYWSSYNSYIVGYDF